MIYLSGGMTEADKKVNTADQDRFKDCRERLTTLMTLFILVGLMSAHAVTATTFGNLIITFVSLQM
jgi:hypothetical protein